MLRGKMPEIDQGWLRRHGLQELGAAEKVDGLRLEDGYGVGREFPVMVEGKSDEQNKPSAQG
jgi:hypothetical protein